MAAIQALQVTSLSGGMLSYVADSLLPNYVASQSLNLKYDVTGRADQRSGLTQLGSTISAGNYCWGMFNFINSSGAVKKLLAAFGTNTYAWNGSTWSAISGSHTNGYRVRYASFLDHVFRVGGNVDTKTWDGSASSQWTDTLASGSPQGKFIVTYKERVYIAGDSTYPDRLYFSSIVDTSNLITWDTTYDWLDVNPEDGNNITALSKVGNIMLIFKDRAMYRWNGTSTDAEVIVDIGTTSQESVVQAKGNVFFFSSFPLGIYVTAGDYPQEISRPIHDWLLAMSSSSYENVCSFGDEDHYYAFIGNITKDGRSYSNVMLVYTISSQAWSVFSFSKNFKCFSRFVDPSISYVGCDDSGEAFTMFSGNTDDGTPITYEYVTKEYEFGDRATTKTITKMAVFVINGAGSILYVSEDGNAFRPIGEIKDKVSIFSGLDIRGRFIKFKLEGSNRSTPVKFEGFEVIEGSNMGYLIS